MKTTPVAPSPKSTSIIVARPSKSQRSKRTTSKTKRNGKTVPKVTGKSSIENEPKNTLPRKLSRGSVTRKVRVTSISMALHQKLGGAGQFSGRDGLITFIFAVLLLKALAGGAGVFLAIDGQYRDANGTNHKCFPPIVEEETSETNETSFLSWNQSLEATNESHDCVRNDTAVMLAKDYGDATMYVITIMTTIGYGHIIATGLTPQIATVVYAMISIPLFFMMVNFEAEWVRQGFAVIYHRISTKLERKPPVEEPKNQCIANFPDLMPFVAVCVITMIYATAMSGIFYAFKEAAAFKTYTDSLYYFLQSAFMIGFGDVLPLSASFQLAALGFIIFAVILCSLITAVLEEWTKHAVKRFVNKIAGVKSVGEQTLDDLIMGPPSEAVLFDVDRSRAPVRPLGDFAATSIRTRPFSVGRIGIGNRDEDDSDDEPSHLANVHI